MKNESKPESTPENKETVEDIFAGKTESNNARFDIEGSMTTWRTHETYVGTGNHKSLWDDLLKEKRLKEKAARIAEEKNK